jgi:predicted O-methyltransferase YrrM
MYLQDTGDWVGYEVIINLLHARGLNTLPGDLVEIGTFVGGGTAKLAKYGATVQKKVFAIDIFDIQADKPNAEGYIHYLDRVGLSQQQAYQYLTSMFPNITTICADSADVRFSSNQKFSFGFIDGNHAAAYVKHDFYLIWRNLEQTGLVAFHDYGGERASVTQTVDSLIQKHQDDIKEIIRVPQKQIIGLIKR